MQPRPFVCVLSVAVLLQNSHPQLSSYHGDCTSHEAQTAHCRTGAEEVCQPCSESSSEGSATVGRRDQVAFLIKGACGEGTECLKEKRSGNQNREEGEAEACGRRPGVVHLGANSCPGRVPSHSGVLGPRGRWTCRRGGHRLPCTAFCSLSRGLHGSFGQIINWER